jgi:hypothetical protein
MARRINIGDINLLFSLHFRKNFKQLTKGINQFKNQLEVSSFVTQSNGQEQMLINAVTGQEMTGSSPQDSSNRKVK